MRRDGEKPSKRMRIKEKRLEKDTMWGQRPLTEEEEGIVRWLHDDGVGKRNVPEKEERQRKLEPWTWVRLEAREVVIEIARSVERKMLDEKTAMEKEREEEIRLVEMMIDMENEKKIGEETKEEKIPDKKKQEVVKVTTKKPQDLKKTKQLDIRTVMTEMDRERRRLERIEKGKKKRDELLCELERRKE